MMTEEDWSITEAPLNDEEYPKPIRHLSVSDGSTLNLGRTRLRFFQTPGVTREFSLQDLLFMITVTLTMHFCLGVRARFFWSGAD